MGKCTWHAPLFLMLVDWVGQVGCMEKMEMHTEFRSEI
jgi:hypothetical protein